MAAEIKLVLLAAAMVLTGCATHQSRSIASFKPSTQKIQLKTINISHADYGNLPVDYQQTLTVLIKSQLKDPYSAVFEFEPPIAGYLRKGAYLKGHEGELDKVGYIINVSINAKNSFGAYTGLKTQSYFYKDGQFEQVLCNPTIFPEPWYQHC